MNSWQSITIEFQLSTEDELIDAAPSESPFVIKNGQHSMPDFLLDRLLVLNAGQVFYFEIDPELGFGKINKDLVIEMSKEKVPDSIRSLTKGDIVEMKDPDKKLRKFRVIKSDENQIVLDGNNPLAGQKLYFEGRVVEKI